jgi:hypothetical protein
MDRVDVYEDGLALVVDYKYSRAPRCVTAAKERNRVDSYGGIVSVGCQAGARPSLAGMLFAGLRRRRVLKAASSS